MKRMVGLAASDEGPIGVEYGVMLPVIAHRQEKCHAMPPDTLVEVISERSAFIDTEIRSIRAVVFALAEAAQWQSGDPASIRSADDYLSQPD